MKQHSHPADLLRHLPQVDKLLHLPTVARLAGSASHVEVVESLRDIVDGARRDVLRGAAGAEALAALFSEAGIAAALEGALHARRLSAYRRAINATGVILHTGLGRAVLPAAAVEAAARELRGASIVEVDVESGERNRRESALIDLLRRLTGAESGTVVNNNAAATLLILAALARGKEVIVSRGQLVEIGGSFRIPDILRESGARLVEVGTTNRTYVDDYRRAITPDTGLLLQVHTSNYEIAGFVHHTALEDLVALGRERGLPVVSDLGSGCFVDVGQYGFRREPLVVDSVRAGADVVCFSGDKLLGGPQAGIALGRAGLIERMRRSPLARALRVDKLVLAALDRTLRFYLDGSALARVPVLRMLLRSPDELRRSAEALARSLRAAGWAAVELEAESGLVGGGALPDLSLPGTVVRLTPRGNGGASAAEMARALRTGTPSVVVRVQRGALVIDPRTLQDEDAAELVSALARLI
jgi:L-seryl-tRNA(Ser) seleniumtransferase